jgi:hypothetical protein
MISLGVQVISEWFNHLNSAVLQSQDSGGVFLEHYQLFVTLAEVLQNANMLRNISVRHKILKRFLILCIG